MSILQQGHVALCGTFCLLFKGGTKFVKFQGLVFRKSCSTFKVIGHRAPCPAGVSHLAELVHVCERRPDAPLIGLSLVVMEVTGWVVLECEPFLYFSSLVPLLIVKLMIELRSSDLWVISSELWFFFMALLIVVVSLPSKTLPKCRFVSKDFLSKLQIYLDTLKSQ